MESFYGARWLEGETGTLCDVGSGAGFPGLALKLVKPGWAVRLYEPHLKKAAFMAEAARRLELEHVEVLRERWGDARLPKLAVDAVTARAVGGYREIAEKSRRVLKSSGRVIFWLGMEEATKQRAVDGWRWQLDPLPDSRERVILVGAPES